MVFPMTKRLSAAVAFLILSCIELTTISFVCAYLDLFWSLLSCFWWNPWGQLYLRQNRRHFVLLCLRASLCVDLTLFWTTLFKFRLCVQAPKNTNKSSSKNDGNWQHNIEILHYTKAIHFSFQMFIKSKILISKLGEILLRSSASPSR